MRAFIHFIIVILFSTTIAGCSGGSNDKRKEYYKVDLSGIESVSLSEIASDVIIIELNAPSEVSVGAIDYIKAYNDYLLLQNSTSSQSITIFKSNGEFVSQLKSIGRGPGEYLAIDCFAVDEKEGILYVYDRSFNVYRYSFPELLYLDKYQVQGHYYNNVEVVEGRFLVAIGPGRPRRLPVGGIAFLDFGSTIPNYLELPDENMRLNMSMPQSFTKSKNGFFYASSGVLSGIYHIDSHGAEHLISIDFGKHNPPKNVMEMLEVDDFYDKYYETPFATFINSVVLTDNKLTFHFMYDKGVFSQYLGVIDRNNSSVSVYSGIELYPGYSRLPYIMGIYDNYYLAVLYPEQINNFLPDDESLLQSWQKQLLEKRNSKGLILIAYKLV